MQAANEHLHTHLVGNILGHLEALAGPTLGYRVDRLEHSLQTATRAHRDGARVDMRSASRYFEGDLGSNAARVTKFAEDLNEAAENAPAPKPEAPAKAAAKGKAAKKKGE